MAKRRGRPCRSGERATKRVDVRLTPTEYADVARFARANKIGLVDALRLGIQFLAAHLDEDGAPPIVIGGFMILCGAPAPVDSLLPPKTRGGLRY